MYRQQKHVQYELTQDALENKRLSIEELEKSEREARRLEEALGQGRPSRLSHSVSGGSSNSETNAQSSNPSSNSAPASPAAGAYGDPHTRDDDSPPEYLPPHPGPGPSRKRSTEMGLINALSYTLHGMMDVDPETARRNNITKTREAISQVCNYCGLGLSVYPPSSCSCVYLPALLFELIAVVAFVSDLFALPFTLGEMEY